ncbi:hypothetical protein ACHAW6_016072 [Cyclotella cf. meneghiniana]
MYTNIPTDIALQAISKYLSANENIIFHHYDSNALIEALQIIFNNNFIQFVRNKELWDSFKQRMQDWHGLNWVFTQPSTTCNFMDMTISITNDKITTTIYEKKQNLYLYIPPHSAHPPSIINGLIFGHILRLHRLCSRNQDIQQKTHDHLNRLIQRGHPISKLIPVFKQAQQRATLLLSQKQTNTPEIPKTSSAKIFLHLPYHPQDPPRSTIQHLWNSTIMNPPCQPPL